MIVIGPGLNSGIGHHAKKYTNVFPDSGYYMFGSQLPDIAYMVDLFLREKGLTEFSRRGVLDMKSGYVLYKFEQ